MQGDMREGGDFAVVDDYTDATSTFGDRLALAREAAGFGQSQLAHQIGVRLPTLRNWEEDRAEPRANKLQMLAGMLNVSMVWLMSGQGVTPEVGRSPARASAATEACLADLRNLRSEQMRLADQLQALEKRLRGVLA